jgi:Zn-dependent M28 family amino/carboxypeptidase
MKIRFIAFGLLGLSALAIAGPKFPWRANLSRQNRLVLEHIRAESLKGHLWFIASDLLEGRGTPSRGLDLAAEYIAAQFRRDGLEPAGDDDYFQTTTMAARGSGDPQKVRNVIGILRGSDPKLKDTYVMVTAHYDHLGVRKTADGDQIYNGANDDGSGTVSVLELAEALASIASMKVRPKRSIVFMTFFGEERGDLGSAYYGKHPAVPLANTIADVNLEQVGRTDDTEGPRVGAVSMTGYDYSDIGEIFAAAGKAVGVGVQKHPRFSDAFFPRSDNQAVANFGVPAHTICTAFVYPDYHRPSDHRDKVDYANMAKVDKMVALGLLMIADSPAEPHWNEANPKTANYVKAWRALHPMPAP